jgi:hypothetical protein
MILSLLLLYYISVRWIQVSIRGMIPWITSMYRNKRTRQKSLRRYMKYWRYKLARLNEKFNNYIKQQYKVVDYEVKKPSQRMTDITWRPYGYSRKIRSIRARRRCIISRNLQYQPHKRGDLRWSLIQTHMRY